MTKEERLEYKKEKNRENQKKYRENNREKIKLYNEKRKEKSKEWYTNNKEKIKEYKLKNKEKIAKRNKLYRENNRIKLNEYSKEWNKNNKEKLNEYYKNKKTNEPLFKLRHSLSNRTLKAFKNKNYIKSKTTLDMLGCDLQNAKSHLEKQFTKGMSWENHGEWHIDHIIPCASAKTEEELIKLFHYTNLQPLWAADNLSKSDKIIEKQLFLL